MSLKDSNVPNSYYIYNTYINNKYNSFFRTNIIPKDVADMFLSAGIDKQRAVEYIVRSDVENFRIICAKVNPENNPEVDNSLRELRRREKNRQSGYRKIRKIRKQLNRIQEWTEFRECWDDAR